MKLSLFHPVFLLLLMPLLYVNFLSAQNLSESEAIGRWDLEVQYGDTWLPSWLEVKLSGNKALVGYFVSVSGSARPIAEVHDTDGLISFSIPPQWNGSQYMHFTGKVKDGAISGNLLDHMGQSHAFRGDRAPSLLYPAPGKWSDPKPLLRMNSLDGWRAQREGKDNQWFVTDGVLTNPSSGVNLRTEAAYMDFKLHIEFRYPEHSNSGVYLRGRYEVQVEDSFGKEPSSIYLGGIYGFLTPSENVARKSGEWQSYDITLVGRRVTVVANGKMVINNQIIPGITGGALNSREATPGPILLQGDHGAVEYRNITISTPAN